MHAQMPEPTLPPKPPMPWKPPPREDGNDIPPVSEDDPPAELPPEPWRNRNGNAGLMQAGRWKSM